ncbi:MAG: 50S ribosomal protein L18 [Candidatus Roizmanbacteria bacterium GW2011_GWA2_35_8]|uniref:Large ribosomal subunit protein uL18 n=1 Tax=Candidatus Roizmanbacteria bacterium GW2011_GWA2_35_8 TaxID=1618479 RepID=A0A0G0D022_9BACT|nr:MAG: 50S ribosomal protein L18 [Candidatus Roizmanbacteria bacterium GW2011_GWA2_35_8]
MRISSKIDGDQKTPRIVVFRSNRYIYAQAIDDVSQKTIASFSSLAFKKAGSKEKLKKSEEAKKIGLKLALILKEKKIDKGVFDRSLYAYAGRVKALCEGLREGGIII